MNKRAAFKARGQLRKASKLLSIVDRNIRLMAFGAEQDAARYECRRCSECPGEEHHWLQPEHDPKTDRSFVPCKHCDAEALLCEVCFECAVWPIVGDAPVCGDCKTGRGDFEP